jgi:hypothetical protein
VRAIVLAPIGLARHRPAPFRLRTEGQPWSTRLKTCYGCIRSDGELNGCSKQVTEVFGLQGLIGGTPQACIFQFAFCLLLYNMIQVVRGYIAAGQYRQPEEISTEKLFDDVQRQLIAWDVIFPPRVTLNYFQRQPRLEALRARLRVLLYSAWSDTWLKSPPQRRHGKTPRKRTRTHHSVYRILQDHCRRKSQPTARAP